MKSELTERIENESPSSEEYFRLRNQLGYLHMLSGDVDSSYQIHRSIYDEVLGVNPAIRAETEYYLAEMYFSMNQKKLALSNLRNCITYFSSHDSPNSFFFRALSTMAHINWVTGDLTAARNTLELIEGENFDNSLNLYPTLVYRYVKAKLTLLEGVDDEAELLVQSMVNWSLENEILLNRAYFFAQFINDSATTASNTSVLVKEIATCKDQSGFTERIITFNELSTYYTRTNQIDKALQSTQQSNQLQKDRIEVLSDFNRIQLDELEKAKTNELQFQLMNKLEDTKSRQIWIFLTALVALYLTGFVIVFRRLINQKNKSQRDLAAKNIELVNKSNQITETQSRLIQSEKMAVLGRLSSGIAHELNTPIGAIKGNVELIHDLQSRELDQWFKVSTLLEPTEFKVLVQLMTEACEKKIQTSSTEEERSIHKKVSKFFEDVQIPNREDVIDIFSDLLVTENLNNYTLLYSHQHNVDVLELALFVFNRSNSVDTAKVALQKAEKILHSFRTYSFRRGWEDFKTVNIHESVEVVLSLHQNSLSKVKVNLTSDGDTEIIGVPDEMSQVWSNIINNSIEAMKGKGELWITITADGENVRVDIKDTGGGIELEDGQDVFDPFFSTKKGGGSGLGMDLTRQIVQKHDGTIKWKNIEKGAIFTVILPKSPRHANVEPSESIGV